MCAKRNCRRARYLCYTFTESFFFMFTLLMDCLVLPHLHHLSLFVGPCTLRLHMPASRAYIIHIISNSKWKSNKSYRMYHSTTRRRRRRRQRNFFSFSIKKWHTIETKNGSIFVLKSMPSARRCVQRQQTEVFSFIATYNRFVVRDLRFNKSLDRRSRARTHTASE